MTLKKNLKIFILYSLYFTISIHATPLITEHTLLTGKLENGFKYTIKENTKPKNRAELRLVIKVGSLDEDDDQKGIAHFIEHMAFNGTKHFPKNEIIKYLESIGVKFGQHLNASTGYEETIYKLAIPLEKDNIEKSFLIFRDWADALSFNLTEFNKERGVILEEARSMDRVGFRLYNQSKHTVLGKSKFMDRIPIGDTEIIKNISLKRAKDFYDKWYRPEFMHFVAVGDFNSSKIEKLIKKYFSSLKNTNTYKRASRNIPDMNYTQVLSLTDKELTSNSLSVQYVDEITYPIVEKDIRDEVIEGILHNLFNLKAEEQLVKENPYATHILLRNQKISNKKGNYSFQVKYTEGNGLSAIKELYELIFSFKKYGFSKEDLNLVKKHRLALNEKKYKRISDMKSKQIISSLVNSAKNDSIVVDYDVEYRLKKKFIEEISLEDINKKYKEILKIKNRVITFVDTKANKVSKKDTLKSIESAKHNLTDYTKTKKLDKKFLDKDLKLKKITSKIYNEKTGVYEYILENKIKVVFKQTDFSKNKITLQATSFGGRSLYSVDRLDTVTKSSSFVQKSGVGKFSFIEMKKLLAGKDISVSMGISNLTENIYGFANSEDIETMFKLIYLKTTQSKIDKTSANNYKQQLKDRVKNEEKNPKVKFAKESSLFYYKNNPRIQYDTNESVDKLNNSEMIELFKERFSDINNFTFLIIGDVKLEKLESLISKYIGNLPTQNKKESFVSREKEYLKGKQKFIRKYNNKNISNIQIMFKSKLKFTFKQKIVLDAMNSILKTRLRELIREEKSGVYGISINTYISRIGKNRSEVRINFSCDPKRKDELISLVYEAIENFKEELISKKELEVYKKKSHKSYETDIKRNHYWITNMIHSYRANTPLEEILEFPNILEKISREEIKQIANDVFRQDILQSELNPKK